MSLEHITLWKSIENVQEMLSWDDYYISEILDIRLNEFIQLKSRREDIPLLGLHYLCKEIGLDEHSFLEFNYDNKTLIQQNLKANDLDIPEKYKEMAYSKMFSLKNIYNTSKCLGKNKYLLKKLQVKPAALELNKNVSCQLISDAFKYLGKYLSPYDYNLMGYKNAILLKDSLKKIQPSKFSKMSDLFEWWLSMEYILEENWSYSIESTTDNSIKINSYPKHEFVDHFKTKAYGSNELNNARSSFASSLVSLYMNNSVGHSMTTKSVHRGDAYCQFTIYANDTKLPDQNLLH